MANTATGIILIAGGITFVNEWYNDSHTINWRVPIATVLAAAVFDGLAHIDSKAATGVSLMVLLGAFVNKVNGRSIADVLSESFSTKTTNAPKQRAERPVMA